eukprot:704069-Prorocentrum_minimum.AAC.1
MKRRLTSRSVLRTPSAASSSRRGRRCRETRSERTLESAIGVSKASPPLVVRAGMKMTLGAMMVGVAGRRMGHPQVPRERARRDPGTGG